MQGAARPKEGEDSPRSGESGRSRTFSVVRTVEDLEIKAERDLDAKITIIDCGAGMCKAREFGVASKLVGRERYCAEKRKC